MVVHTLSSFDQGVDEFCVEARDDYVGLWQVAMRAAKRTKPNEAAREEALSIVRALLGRGVRAGNLTADGGFRAWPDQEPDSVIDRIRREWIALGRAPSVNDIVWFDLAPP